MRGPKNPDFSKKGSGHPSVKPFPVEQANRHVTMLDPKTQKYTFIDTCLLSRSARPSPPETDSARSIVTLYDAGHLDSMLDRLVMLYLLHTLEVAPELHDSAVASANRRDSGYWRADDLLAGKRRRACGCGGFVIGSGRLRFDGCYRLRRKSCTARWTSASVSPSRRARLAPYARRSCHRRSAT